MFKKKARHSLTVSEQHVEFSNQLCLIIINILVVTGGTYNLLPELKLVRILFISIGCGSSCMHVQESCDHQRNHCAHYACMEFVGSIPFRECRCVSE